MDAAKCADCFSMIDGNVGQQADVEQAYTGGFQRDRDVGPDS